MISSDSNANRMLLAVLDNPEWREDMPAWCVVCAVAATIRALEHDVANAWGSAGDGEVLRQIRIGGRYGTSTLGYGATTRAVAGSRCRIRIRSICPGRKGRDSCRCHIRARGKPWVMVRATAALPLSSPLSSGYRIRRSFSPVQQKQAGTGHAATSCACGWNLRPRTDMTWVVVDDPVPAGAGILGNGLGGQSNLLARGERREGWAWPRSKSGALTRSGPTTLCAQGKRVVEYTVRLNNPGTFLLPATRVEAMYAPEMLGEAPNATLTVER